MTREETVKLLMMIQATFPNFKVEDKSTTVDAWLMVLEEYNINDVYLAFKSYCKSANSGFAPSVSQLITEMEKPQDLAIMDEAEAWALVRKAISRSTYNSKAEFDNLPPTVQKAVGSPDILYSWATNEYYSDSKVMEVFTFNYKNVCKRKREFEKLPTQMQARVEAFIEKVPQLDNNTLLIGSLEPNLEPNLEPRLEVNNEMPLGTYTRRLEEMLST